MRPNSPVQLVDTFTCLKIQSVAKKWGTDIVKNGAHRTELSPAQETWHGEAATQDSNNPTTGGALIIID